MSVSIKDVYARNGRVRNKPLIDLINSVPLHQFSSMISHPMLVSRKLYEGQMQAVGDSRNTMVFDVQAIKDQIKKNENMEETISQFSDENFNSAIFALTKSADLRTSENVFSIGRVIPNDIVIPDFTISKLHATIRLIDQKYYLSDIESTNGTLVAGMLIQANEPQVLKSCDFITFGRLGFVFMPPEKLYELLRR
ncbi:MAG: FHA domain-containing protein [Lentisphaeraceae bacterium]|nr:FHA domain-containing protein [Lentisphaeraceae bacterium]